MKDEIIATVYKTMDYDKFSFIAGNRDTDHVKALVLSMKQRLVPNAILCNEKYEIIDGQNRFLAHKELGIPILYYCIDGLNIYDVASLNSFGKNWGTLDFVKMWAELGKEEYKKILDFNDEFVDLGIVNNLMILSDSTAGGKSSLGSDKTYNKYYRGGSQQSKVKNGTFVINDVEHARFVVRCIMQYKPYCKPGKQIYKQNAFCSAMMQLLRKPNFDNSEMVRKIDLYPTMFYRCINAQEYILMLEELWNYKRRNIIRLNY